MSQQPRKSDPATLSFASQAVHAGNRVDPGTGAVRAPLVLANSYELAGDPSEISWSSTDPGLYTRNTGTNQALLQEKLAVLEGAEDAVALASGVAALHAVFFAHLRSGDHVVVSDSVYEATWRLLSELLPQKYGIEASFVDVSDHDAVRAALRPSTRIVQVEAIANPTTRVADIAALAEIAHAVGALLVVDSTFTPPPLFRPLGHGADLVVHSLTKFINGHGDAMGGAVLGSAELIAPIRAEAQVDVGGVLSPFNAWLITRGSVTLPLRLRQQLASAQRIAEFLERHPAVAYVAYPGLASHPQHELASAQFTGGFGGVLAFGLRGGREAHNTLVAGLGLITSAVSLGHDETLIVHVGGDGPRAASYPAPFRELGHLRLAVGIEETEDLLTDLAGALAALAGGKR